MSNWFLIIVEISWTQIVFVEKKNKQTLSLDEKKTDYVQNFGGHLL